MLQKILRGPGIEPGSTAWKAAMLTITPATLVKSLQKQKTPEVRLELTAYLLTAVRATHCAIQELTVHKCARGLVVMIVACQVMDPGSIPGERNFFVHKKLF